MRSISSTFLRAVIGLDAAVCGALGLGFAAGGAALGLSPDLTRWIGLFLVGYAALLTWMALRPQLPRAAVWVLAAFNLVWAVESVLIVRLGWVAPNPAGQAVLHLQAAGAFGVAAMQVLALRLVRPLAA